MRESGGTDGTKGVIGDAGQKFRARSDRVIATAQVVAETFVRPVLSWSRWRPKVRTRNLVADPECLGVSFTDSAIRARGTGSAGRSGAKGSGQHPRMNGVRLALMVS